MLLCVVGGKSSRNMPFLCGVILTSSYLLILIVDTTSALLKESFFCNYVEIMLMGFWQRQLTLTIGMVTC